MAISIHFQHTHEFIFWTGMGTVACEWYGENFFYSHVVSAYSCVFIWLSCFASTLHSFQPNGK